MLTKVMREFYEYGMWASHRLLDAAEGLTPEQFLESDLDGIWSIRDSLVHIMLWQWTWTERWNDRPPTRFPEDDRFSDVATIRTFWTGVDGGIRALFDRLDDDQLARDLTCRDFSGNAWTFPFWGQLLQVANHSTYHRGEIAALLTRHGASPGELDFLVYRDEQRG